MFYRTDLALERRDIYNQANNLENDLEGIECNEEKPNEKLSITRVRIKDEEGENIENMESISVKTMKMKMKRKVDKKAPHANNKYW